MNGGRKHIILLDDEQFNCTDFNIGYVNFLQGCVWYYRVPQKQYRQGLHPNQVKAKMSKREHAQGVNFNMGKPVADMLENTYPRPARAIDLIKTGAAVVVAFHRDFAISLDRIHADYIVEHKGTLVGHTADLKDFRLMEEFQHLSEKLQESVA
jgi:hypothetical protein